MRAHPSLPFAVALIATLASALLPSCLLAVDEGREARLAVVGRVGAASSVDGVEVSLDEAWLHFASAELVACEGEPEARGGSLLGPSFARAHHGSSDGTALYGAHAVALHEAAHTLGAFHPPPGRYCALRLTVTPADTLAEGLSDPALVGWTLLARGRVDGAAREVNGYEIDVWELPLAEPLDLEATPQRAELEVSLDLPAAVARLSLAGPDTLDADLVSALAETAEVRVRLVE